MDPKKFLALLPTLHSLQDITSHCLQDEPSKQFCRMNDSVQDHVGTLLLNLLDQKVPGDPYQFCDRKENQEIFHRACYGIPERYYEYIPVEDEESIETGRRLLDQLLKTEKKQRYLGALYHALNPAEQKFAQRLDIGEYFADNLMEALGDELQSENDHESGSFEVDLVELFQREIIRQALHDWIARQQPPH